MLKGFSRRGKLAFMLVIMLMAVIAYMMTRKLGCVIDGDDIMSWISSFNEIATMIQTCLGAARESDARRDGSRGKVDRDVRKAPVPFPIPTPHKFPVLVLPHRGPRQDGSSQWMWETSSISIVSLAEQRK